MWPIFEQYGSNICLKRKPKNFFRKVLLIRAALMAVLRKKMILWMSGLIPVRPITEFSVRGKNCTRRYLFGRFRPISRLVQFRLIISAAVNGVAPIKALFPTGLQLMPKGKRCSNGNVVPEQITNNSVPIFYDSHIRRLYGHVKVSMDNLNRYRKYRYPAIRSALCLPILLILIRHRPRSSRKLREVDQYILSN